VEALLSDVAASLQAGGMFVSTFRDYTVPLVGQRVSAYQKLQLSTEWMTQVLRDLGFSVRVEPGLAGMVRVVATAG
jgi:hypothetical protein